MSNKLEVRTSRLESKKSQVALGNIKEAIKSAQIVLAVDLILADHAIYNSFYDKVLKLRDKANKYLAKHPEATREQLEDYLKGK